MAKAKMVEKNDVVVAATPVKVAAKKKVNKIVTEKFYDFLIKWLKRGFPQWLKMRLMKWLLKS